MSRSLTTRRFRTGLIALTILSCTLAVAALSSLALLWAEGEMVQAVSRTASAVAHSVRYDVERALKLGIPLDRMEGMPEYIERLLEGNPDIRDITIAGPDGRPLFQHGRGAAVPPEPVAAASTLPPVAASNTLPPVAAAGYSISVVPLAQGGGVRGFVHVAVRREEILDRFLENLRPLLAGGLVVLMIAYELATFAAFAFYLTPLARLSVLLAAGGRGDVTTPAGRIGRDDVGRTLMAGNAAVARLHESLSAFRATADNVRDAVYDPDVAGKVEAVRDAVVQDLGPMPAVPARLHPDDPRPTDLHPPLIFLAAGAILVLSLAYPGIAGGPDPGVAGGEGATIRTLIPATAIPAAGVMAAATWRHVRTAGGERGAVAMATATLLFACLALTVRATFGTALTATLAAGLALGMVAGAGLGYAGRAGAGLPGLWVTARLGSGIAIGGLAGTLLGGSPLPWTALATAVLLALAGGLGAAALMVRTGPRTGPEAGPFGG